MNLLQGKIAVVTGATSGIGEAVAKRFLDEGAFVIGIGRNQQKLDSLQAQYHGQCLTYSCDVSCQDEIEKICEKIRAEFPAVHVLYNGAGISAVGLIEDYQPEDWRLMFAVNVDAIYHFCRNLLPCLKAAGHSAIVNVSSTAGLVGAPLLPAYSASKGAVIQLTKSLAGAYAEFGIRCNALCPGATDTPMLGGLDQEFMKLIPMQRAANPEEIANAALFLADDSSSFVTGAALPVDGGFTCI